MENSRRIPAVVLAGGIQMPQIGYGVFGLEDYEECYRCVSAAIDCGYRLFDTAAAYFNEQAVGDAVKAAVAAGKAAREDFFLTTKVWLQDYGEKETRASVLASLQKLGTEYLDLVLLHQPYGQWMEGWHCLEELQQEGLVRAIGTSNFTEPKMRQLLAEARVQPQVNQIEIHPFFTQGNYTSRLRKKGIQTEAWGPLNEGQRGIFSNPVLTAVGQAHGRTAAQTALRWNLQRGNVIIPKSTKPEHMRENLEILDFTLSPEEMQQVETLDEGRSEIVDFSSPVTERLMTKWKIHP